MSQSARYRISHRTEYVYSEPVAICQNQLRMMPRSMTRHTGSIECHGLKTTIDPQPDFVQQHVDYFGNNVYSFSIESLHKRLVVEVNSEMAVIETQSLGERVAQGELATPWEAIRESVLTKSDQRWFEVQEFRFNSPRIQSSLEFSEYANASFRPGRGMLESAFDLTKRIRGDFKYDTSATNVNTETDRAFRLRAGVCQDFAHIQIACLRSIGLSAKYVSGYLRTHPPEGKPRLVGADESHAWVSVYAGPEIGWIDVDPTNGCFADTNHIAVCLGRDYGDVTPMRGVVTGGGNATLGVRVDVMPLSVDA